MMNQQLTGIQEPVYISKTASLGENVLSERLRISATM